MKIIIVDEEPRFSDQVSAYLEIDGHEVTCFSDATTAGIYLTSMVNVSQDLRLLVDMALSPGADGDTYTRDRTKDFMTTGLVMIQDVFSKSHTWRNNSAKIVFYSAHYRKPFWSSIEAFASAHSIKVLKKRPNTDAEEILRTIGAI